MASTTRLFLLLVGFFLALSSGSCSGRRLSGPPEQVLTYGRLAVFEYNKQVDEIIELSGIYNQACRELSRLNSIVGIGVDHSTERERLLQEVISAARKLRKAHHTSYQELDRVIDVYGYLTTSEDF